MSEQAGLQLLAAIEALHAEIRGMREEMRTDRAARETLVHKRKLDAARQAKRRDSSRDNHVTVPTDAPKPEAVTLQSRDQSRDNHVTPQVVKALDLVVASQEQTTRTKNLPRHVTVTRQPESHVTVEERPTVATRKAYAAAFANRWGTDPLINKKANGMLKHFVDLVGQEAAPAVAAFYLSHNGALYVNAKHPINLLLRDANKLHTEWKTDTPSTETEARLKERTEANFGGWAKHLSTAGKG